MAAYDLFDISYRVARELGELIEGKATGGSTSSVVDLVYLKDLYNDDHFNGGTVWVTYDAAGAGAAPQGEYARVTDFASAAGTATTETLTAAITANDLYGIAGPKYSLYNIISHINATLDEIPVPTVDTTTIDTASAQTEYSLPAALLTEYGLEVWTQTVTGDANDNRWVPLHDWYIQDTATGTQQLLVFKIQPHYIYDVKVKYYTPHPHLTTVSAKLRESVDINRVVFDAALRCLLWKQSQIGDSDPDLERRIALMAPRAERAKARNPIKMHKFKMSTYGMSDIGVEEQTG